MEQVISSRTRLKKELSRLVISSMMLALSIVFMVVSKLIPGLTWPNAGSISFSMAPLVLCALICGPVWGTFIGLVFGIFNMLFGGGAAYGFVSVILDYLVAFGSVGIAALFRKFFFQKKAWSLIAGQLVYGVIRFFCHFLSGVIVFTSLNYDEAGNQIAAFMPDFSIESVTYSLTYNLGYLLPSIALCVLILLLVAKPVFTLLSSPNFVSLAPKGVDMEQKARIDEYKFSDFLWVYLVILFGLALTASIKQAGVYFLGYISLSFSLFLSIYTYIKMNSEENKWKDVLFLIGFIVTLGLSIFSIVSYFTLGK